MGANTKEPVASNFQFLEVITQSLLNTVQSRSLYVWAMNNTTSTASDIYTEEEQGRAEEEKARSEWDFRLCTVVSPGQVPDIVGAIDFDPTDRLVASGGIARKIRIYSLRTLLPPEGHAGGAVAFYDHSTACDFYICTPAKLGSLRWRPASGGRVLCSGDYDGVVTEYDVERRVAVFERDEHAGRHVRSVDYSTDGELGASGSDDGTAQLWDTRCGGRGSVAVARAGAAVCGVEFDPGGGPWVGVGSADRHAYVYDVRAVSAGPVAVFAGHGRAVTYVRFAGGRGRAVVSSGTDNSHRLWDWVGGGGGGGVEEVRAYRGHANALRFVGMSVWRTGRLVASGSESNEVFVYDLRLEEPIWVRGFEDHGREAESGFVSAVSWRQAAETEAQADGALLAGGSNGALQAFVCKRKTLPN